MTNTDRYKIVSYGEDGWLVRMIGGDLVEDAGKMQALCRQLLTCSDVFDVTPGLDSLAVRFAPAHGSCAHAALENALACLLDGGEEAGAAASLEIPICFDDRYAEDMDFIADHTGLGHDEIVSLCTRPIHVLNMGFAPGFAYLGPIDKRLTVPRRKNPRTHVPAGALGIANGLLCLYSISSPGGWHMIGRTPARLFDPDQDDPFFLKPGASVLLKPISAAAFERFVQP